MNFTLKSPIYRIKAIKKKTGAKAFKEMKVGDTFQLANTISNRAGASGGGSYATYLTVYHFDKVGGGINTVSANIASGIINDSFELEVV